MNKQKINVYIKCFIANDIIQINITCYKYTVSILQLRITILCLSLNRIHLPVRANLRKCELRGIFPESKVVRGFNWEWGNQDGGEGSFYSCYLLLINCGR